MHHRLIVLSCLLVLSACGSSSSDDNAIASAVEATTTTQAPAETTTSTDTLLAMLETDAGRALFVEGIADESGMTIDEASCFVDNIDVESFLTMAAEPTAEQMVQILEALGTCDIDPSILLG